MRRHLFGLTLTLLGLIAVVLGTIGFYKDDPGSGTATAFYKAMQLFYWNSSFGSSVPWTLEIARWLAPLITFGALSRVAIALFRKQWDAFRARRRRGHTVIIGGGEQGSVLAADLRRRGLPFVLIEHDSDRADSHTASGFLTIQGDATEPATLRRAAISQASRVVVTTGDDHRNLAIAIAAVQLGAPSIYADSGDATLCDLYQRNHALASALSPTSTIRVFNHDRNLARATLQAFPPDASLGDIHVILPDLSHLSLTLAFECALVGHYPADRLIHLHLVGTQATLDTATLRARYPSIDRCLHLHAVDLLNAATFSSQVASLVQSTPGSFTIFPGFTDENAAFSRALELMELLPAERVRLLLLPRTDDSPMRTLIAQNPVLSTHIHFLPSHSQASSYESIIGESLDRTARLIHDNWLADTRRQIDTARASGDESLAQRHESKSTFRPWEALTEEQKGASRSQADHIPFKIRAAALDPATVTPDDWKNLDDSQIETLAKMEHARWAAYLWMTGWTHAPARDDSKKLHPNLVPYDHLDEPTKDYDRAAIRHLGAYLS